MRFTVRFWEGDILVDGYWVEGDFLDGFLL